MSLCIYIHICVVQAYGYVHIVYSMCVLVYFRSQLALCVNPNLLGPDALDVPET